jgi:arsenate reductase (thioredoxin)
MKAKILILCTGNSCRSQMAEGYLRSLDNELEVFSAGTFPASKINLHAVDVMKQAGIDISRQYPKNADEFVNKSFDYVITVCDNAKEACPVFTGEVKNRLHIGFDDPYEAKGTYEEVIAVYKRVRDEIMRDFKKFYEDIKSKQEV